MIVKNSLLNYKEIIYQDDEWFKFSIDSVLLANFVTINMGVKKIITGLIFVVFPMIFNIMGII